MKKFFSLCLMFVSSTCFAECGDKCGWFNEGNDSGLICEDLGYKPVQDIFCADGFITCPFDDSYIWCKEYHCEDAGMLSEAAMAEQRAKGFNCIKERYHGQNCYNCDECMVNTSLCKYKSQEGDRGQLVGECCDGNYRECVPEEFPPVENIPANASVKKENILNCGVEMLVETGFECDAGYRLAEGDLSCEPIPCAAPTTYTDILFTTEENKPCEGEGYFLEQAEFIGGKVCSRCRPKDCAEGYTKGLLEESCNLDIETYQTSGFSGDLVCGMCESKNCVFDINDCPSLSVEGYSPSKAYEPLDGVCPTCEPKTCAEGFSDELQSVADCPNEQGYTFDYDENVFNGDKLCGKCEAKTTCESGSTDLELLSCNYLGSVGAVLENTGAYVGTTPCKQCACHATAEEPTGDSTETYCPYTLALAHVGDSGIPVGTAGRLLPKDRCCNGYYKNCMFDIRNYPDYYPGTCPTEHVQTCTTVSACGNTYYKITECDEGYEPVNGVCVVPDLPEGCAVSNCSSCLPGYHVSMSFSGGSGPGIGSQVTYTCIPNTCFDHPNVTQTVIVSVSPLRRTSITYRWGLLANGYTYGSGTCDNTDYIPQCTTCYSDSNLMGSDGNYLTCYSKKDIPCSQLSCYSMGVRILLEDEEDDGNKSCGLVKGVSGKPFLLDNTHTTTTLVSDLEDYNETKHNSSDYTEVEYTVYSGDSTDSDPCPYKCYRYVANDTCPSGTSKSCPCTATYHSTTPAGSRCYTCSTPTLTPEEKTACEQTCEVDCVAGGCGYTCPSCSTTEYERLQDLAARARKSILYCNPANYSCAGYRTGGNNMPRDCLDSTWGTYSTCGFHQPIQVVDSSLADRMRICQASVEAGQSSIDTWNENCPSKQISKGSPRCDYCVYDDNTGRLSYCTENGDGTIGGGSSGGGNGLSPAEP